MPTKTLTAQDRAELAEITRLLDRNRVEAVVRAKALVARHPSSIAPRMYLAAALSRLQDYAAAVEILRDCARQELSPSVTFNLGYCLRQIGEYQGALNQFLIGLTLPASGPDMHLLAADTAAILGERQFALQTLAGLSGPEAAFRQFTIENSISTAMLEKPEAADRAVLFWMKYDCHLYGRLDNKAGLATFFRISQGRPPWYWPESYGLPEEVETARLQLEQSGAAEYWIWKPAGESGGRGIKVINASELRVLRQNEHGIVQRLIDPPFLYEGRKLNLRLLLGLPRPHPEAAVLWKSGLVYISTDAYCEPGAKNTTGLVANLLQTDPARLAAPIGSLPAHVVRLERLLDAVALPKLRNDLVKLAADLVRDLDVRGLFASERAIGQFAPRFLGLDVGLDASGQPWPFEIERYPGLGGVTPLSAAINTQFRHDWMRMLLAGDKKSDPNFIALCS